MQEFNIELVEKNENLIIIDYTKLANEKVYNIEMEFMDDFVELVNKDDFLYHIIYW